MSTKVNSGLGAMAIEMLGTAKPGALANLKLDEAGREGLLAALTDHLAEAAKGGDAGLDAGRRLIEALDRSGIQLPIQEVGVPHIDDNSRLEARMGLFADLTHELEMRHVSPAAIKRFEIPTMDDNLGSLAFSLPPM